MLFFADVAGYRKLNIDRMKLKSKPPKMGRQHLIAVPGEYRDDEDSDEVDRDVLNVS